MSDANNNKDLSQGRECQAYALEKLENLLEDPMQMKMNMSLSRFVKTILKILLNRDYLPEALTELFPESVEPHYADKMPSETDTWKRDFNNDQTGYRWRFLVSQTESTGLNHLLRDAGNKGLGYDNNFPKVDTKIVKTEIDIEELNVKKLVSSLKV